MSNMGRRLAFDRFSVDLRSHELFCDGRPVPLQEKPFRLLVALLERPGDVVTRAELYDALWPRGTHVEREAGLNTAVRKLRAALRGPSEHDLVETVPRVGYRIRTTTRVIDGDGLRSSGPRPPAPSPAGLPARLRIAAGAVLAIAVAIAMLATDRQPERATEPMPAAPDLRALYVEARGQLATGDLMRARELLTAVVEGAPDFAGGHAHLAEVCAWIAVNSGAEVDIAAARAAVERAQALDPDSAVAHRGRAMIALHFDHDLSTAAIELDRALDSAPDDPVNHLARATYESILGQHEPALAAIRTAVDLAPETMSIRSDAGYFLLRAGRYSDAIAECEMVLRLDPENRFGRECLVIAHALGGSPDAARAVAMESMRLEGASESDLADLEAAPDPRAAYLSWSLERLLTLPDPPPIQVASRYVALGDDDRALYWLGRAAERRTPGLLYVPGDLRFARLDGDERYARILRRAGLEMLAAS